MNYDFAKYVTRELIKNIVNFYSYNEPEPIDPTLCPEGYVPHPDPNDIIVECANIRDIEDDNEQIEDDQIGFKCESTNKK